MQTNCVIYLPVVVKGAKRFFALWRDVRRGLPENTTHPPNAATLLCQRRRCTLLTLDTAPLHVKMCRWLTSYVPRSQFQVL